LNLRPGWDIFKAHDATGMEGACAMPCKISLILFVMLVFWGHFPLVGKADIYQYVDPNGVIHLTNVPTNPDIPYLRVMKERRVQLHLPGEITRYDDLIVKKAAKYRMDSSLVKAIIKAESNFNHRAVSPVGARGLMQLMPTTAASLQVQDSFHPENNVDGGVRYLRYLMNLFNDNLPLVLAAYNAGENAVLRYNNRIPPYPETQTYVKRVLQYLDEYRRQNPTP
jgi:soluble lytic murein transglycosylase-like protein